jgi:FtsH-binding integral membrane protein
VSSYAQSTYGSMPISRAPEASRVAFLRAVGLKTLGSLGITAVAAVAMMALIANGPDILTHRWVAMGIMLGGIYGAQYIGNRMTASTDPSTRTMGFVVGSALSGIALSYILGSAAVVSSQVFGNPYNLIVQAGGLVLLTMLGMVAYLMTGPKELNWLRAGLSIMFLPMLGLMAVVWLFPIGGTMGLVFSALFVLISAGGLLYSLNRVMHTMDTSQATAAAFMISTGVVILFWNLLALLSRLTSRN